MSVIPPKVPTVDPITRELNYTSVSALQKFNVEEQGGCPKRWWFRYVEGFREEQTSQQAEGTKGHTQVEHYLPTGEDVLGPIAAAGRHLLPPPGKDLLVEWGLNDKPRPADIEVEVDGVKTRKQINHFPPDESLVTADGLPLIGFMDWLNPRGWYMTPAGVWTKDHPHTIEVGDNKFSSNVAYAKTAAELTDSTQMLGYGRFLMAKYPGLEYVRASHVTYQTKNAKTAVKTTALIPVAIIAKNWEKRGAEVVRRMREVALLRREADVPGNTNSCRAYNKDCDHLHRCSANRSQTPLQRIKSMGLMKDRQAAIAGTPAAQPNGAASAGTTPWIPPPPPVAPRKVTIQDEVLTAKEAVAGIAYRFSTGTVGMFLSKTEEGYFSFLPVVNGVQGGQPFPVGGDEPVVSLAPPPVAVAPPPPPVAVAPPPPPVAVAPPPPPVAVAPPPPPVAVAPPPPPATHRDPGAPPPPPPLGAQTAAPKRGPGRPKKDGITAPSPIPALDASGITLFVNAVPNGAFVDLTAYTNEVLAQMQEEFKVSDLRCAPMDSPLAYNKWRGVLASVVRADPPASGVYVAFTKGNELLEVVADALSGLCGPGRFIRGV